ncbi:hypothetical protein Val02_74070 [Virgisporangium aliadipatigenens]|uniref:Uncharacterized protein n=1 Tax=Virgisporangium aliadipatigenens TaxID=741659 RepID=A0A8J3YS71_9ACTN|nr:hypothetical protein Val02_74070 [Virgisporangium aliadipatigenens]
MSLAVDASALSGDPESVLFMGPHGHAKGPPRMRRASRESDGQLPVVISERAGAGETGASLGWSSRTGGAGFSIG